MTYERSYGIVRHDKAIHCTGSFSPSCSDLFRISEECYVQMKLTLDSKWPRLGSDSPRHNGHVMSKLCPIKLANLQDGTIASLLLRPVMLHWKSQTWSSQATNLLCWKVTYLQVVSWIELLMKSNTENAWHPDKPLSVRKFLQASNLAASNHDSGCLLRAHVGGLENHIDIKSHQWILSWIVITKVRSTKGFSLHSPVQLNFKLI